MADPSARQPISDSPRSAGTAGTVLPALALKHGHRLVPLTSERTVIGRSSSCDIQIEGGTVSRRHALLIANRDGARISDLDSRNGVLVNGAPIDRETPVRAGDMIAIGDEQMQLVEHQRGSRERRETDSGLRSSRTPTPPQSARISDGYRAEDGSMPTRTANAFELLAGVVEKALALGRIEEAERLLGTRFASLLEEAKNGSDIPERIAEPAARLALRFAAATTDADWIDYAIRLYATLARPLPLTLVEELYSLLRQVRGADTILLRHYAAVLRARVETFTPSQRFILQRIDGLERIAAL